MKGRNKSFPVPAGRTIIRIFVSIANLNKKSLVIVSSSVLLAQAQQYRDQQSTISLAFPRG